MEAPVGVNQTSAFLESLEEVGLTTRTYIRVEVEEFCDKLLGLTFGNVCGGHSWERTTIRFVTPWDEKHRHQL